MAGIAILDLLLTISNIQLFQPLGIRVVVKAVITWSSRDQITVSRSSVETLGNFARYSQRQINSRRDATILLS